MSDVIREIAFDTETTGLNPADGDRVIEIGAVEMHNHIATGRTFRVLINPKRSVSEDTVRITGITDGHLKDAPYFEHPEVVDAFLEFLGDATIVAHNAGFDRGFINMELERCGRPPIPEERWIDTAAMARKKYPGAPASLDALCRRYDISLESRTFHGALLDSQLLASVYLELLGGRARAFSFETAEEMDFGSRKRTAKQRPQPLASQITEEERAAHEAFIESLGDDAIWKKVS
ncbi:MAG: DNA polymerase III subunit epsilon [Alphaproteobacteria bacterium]|nr:DNA polymerase III subunit epsilon [Hyphomonas sp.]MBR9809010.1 DNA polymerase III subunit epsilon [Alphaproteobacteria bacterium]|tara:strand:- start:2124 stop:2825 length:702 start_codon:yes stop_codon:yes gene_type:complete